jgi:hypothetical protein
MMRVSAVNFQVMPFHGAQIGKRAETPAKLTQSEPATRCTQSLYQIACILSIQLRGIFWELYEQACDAHRCSFLLTASH